MARHKGVITSAILTVAVVLLFAPLITYDYQVQVPYQTTETRQVPYQEAIITTTNVYSIPPCTLQSGSYTYQSARISSGEDVSVTWSAEDALDAMVFSSNEFAVYESNSSNARPIVNETSQQTDLMFLARGKLGFHAWDTDDYYLVIYNNPHTSFFNAGSHNVRIFSAIGTVTRQETITNYTTETVTVTKWRTDIRHARVSLLDLLLGRLPS